MSIFKNVSFLIEQLFMSKTCPSCQALLWDHSEWKAGVCQKCIQVLAENHLFCQSLCPHCLTSDHSIKECRYQNQYDLDELYFLYKYEVIQPIMVYYKLYNNIYLDKFFARCLDSYFSFTQDVILAPCNPKNYKARGWDPMRMIAQKLHKLNQCHVMNDVFYRLSGVSQKTLNKQERHQNLENKIFVKKKYQKNLPKKVILLDDIFTTGTTVQICCQLLKHYGVDYITVITIAKV